MYLTIDYYYYCDNRRARVATIIFDGRRISYELNPDLESMNLPECNPDRIEEHIEHIINLPLLRSELRSKTLPKLFRKIESNSLDHFLNIPHDTTYFRFSRIREWEGHYLQKRFFSATA